MALLRMRDGDRLRLVLLPTCPQSLSSLSSPARPAASCSCAGHGLRRAATEITVSLTVLGARFAIESYPANAPGAD